MPKYIFTTLAFVFFLLLMAAKSTTLFADAVSPKSVLLAYRENHVVKQGVSQDGRVVVLLVPPPPPVSHYREVANHQRNLRAFTALDSNGTSVVYVEQARPHQFFIIQGAFSVLPETVFFTWVSPTTLIFYGTSPDGVFTRVSVDVHTLLTTSMPAPISSLLQELSPELD